MAHFDGADRAKVNKIYNELYSKYGVAGAGMGGIRLCPHIYNTMEDVERAVRGVAELVA
ncbi:MAG: hypothetical protein HY236_13730 [Acidobacteria bacterium]|nr:hypothetical protein [Acidobacteriota bacterium]